MAFSFVPAAEVLTRIVRTKYLGFGPDIRGNLSELTGPSVSALINLPPADTAPLTGKRSQPPERAPNSCYELINSTFGNMRGGRPSGIGADIAETLSAPEKFRACFNLSNMPSVLVAPDSNLLDSKLIATTLSSIVAII